IYSGNMRYVHLASLRSIAQKSPQSLAITTDVQHILPTKNSLILSEIQRVLWQLNHLKKSSLEDVERHKTLTSALMSLKHLFFSGLGKAFYLFFDSCSSL